jgi:hypothetical protein
MFLWYSKAVVCIAFLSDVQNFSQKDSLVSTEYKGHWKESRWFTRGWTLQELIAPREVRFYDGNWNYIGTKHSLATEIALTTRIHESILRGEKTLDEFSVAQKMSWAANRQTTEPEDRAYSLLGIFDVSMSLVYDGNGYTAFNILQDYIIKKTNDHSIFAWTAYGPSPWEIKTSIYKWKCNLFAPSPDCFRFSRDIVPYSPDEYPDEPFEFKNNGLYINIPVRVIASRDEDVLLEGGLACKDISKCSGQSTILFSTSRKDCDPLFSRQGERTYTPEELSLHFYKRVPVVRVEPYYLGTVSLQQDQEGLSVSWKRFPLQIKEAWSNVKMPARPEGMTIQLIDQLSKTDCAIAKNYIEYIRSQTEKAAIEAKEIWSIKNTIQSSKSVSGKSDHLSESNSQDAQYSNVTTTISDNHQLERYIPTIQDKVVLWSFLQKGLSVSHNLETGISPRQCFDESLSDFEGETAMNDRNSRGSESVVFDESIVFPNGLSERNGISLLILFFASIFVASYPLYSCICILVLIVIKSEVIHDFGLR